MLAVLWFSLAWSCGVPGGLLLLILTVARWQEGRLGPVAQMTHLLTTNHAVALDTIPVITTSKSTPSLRSLIRRRWRHSQGPLHQARSGTVRHRQVHPRPRRYAWWICRRNTTARQPNSQQPSASRNRRARHFGNTSESATTRRVPTCSTPSSASSPIKTSWSSVAPAVFRQRLSHDA